MKRLKFRDLLRDSISKYAALSLHLSKCNSRFSVLMLLDNTKLTSKSCDFGTWYFTQKSHVDLPSLKEVEAPYIKVFELYKKLEEQIEAKVNKIDNFKKRIPFLKYDQDPIQEIISDLHIQCLFLVNALKKVETEYITYQAIKAPLQPTSSNISRKIEANLAIIKNNLVEVESASNGGQTLVKKNNSAPHFNIEPEGSGSRNEDKQSKFKNIVSNTELSAASFSPDIKKSIDTTPIDSVKNNLTNLLVERKTSRNVEWESLIAMKKLMDELN